MEADLLRGAEISDEPSSTVDQPFINGHQMMIGQLRALQPVCVFH